MSREVRMVPPGWEHPMEWREQWDRLSGRIMQKRVPKPLFKDFAGAMEKFEKNPEWWDGCAPLREKYMPDFPEGTATHLMMYETCSEGTPISPAFETPEELAHWLADNKASAFGSMTATYEQWLSTCKRGWAISAVSIPGVGVVSGVEADL